MLPLPRSTSTARVRAAAADTRAKLKRWALPAVLTGTGLALLYVDATFSVFGERGIGQTRIADTPIRTLWVVILLWIAAVVLAARTKSP
ncbi:MAG: hypothetical protein MOGMAGMI_01616 [Candidatus Omnitrophica bacterium]|nr:hypothetical protein [Candidatus Omnitrophota bacterium]